MWATGKLWTGELIDHLPEIVTDLRELNDFIVSALPKIGDAAVYVVHALEGLHDMSAQDLQHLTIGGDHFGVNWGPEVPKQTINSGPLHKDEGERKREEDLIHQQFGVNVTPALERRRSKEDGRRGRRPKSQASANRFREADNSVRVMSSSRSWPRSPIARPRRKIASVSFNWHRKPLRSRRPPRRLAQESRLTA